MHDENLEMIDAAHGAATRSDRLMASLRGAFRAARRGASTLDYMIVAAILGLVCFGIMNLMSDKLESIWNLADGALSTIGF